MTNPISIKNAYAAAPYRDTATLILTDTQPKKMLDLPRLLPSKYFLRISRFFVQRGLSVFAVCGVLFLVGCAPQFDYQAWGQEWIRTHYFAGQFETPKGTANLLNNEKDGTTTLLIGTYPLIDVPGHSNLKVEISRTDHGLVPKVNDQTIAVLKGSSRDCPVDYRLTVFDPNGDYAILPIGDCHSELEFYYTEDNQLFYASQTTGRDPLLWCYTNKKVYGPIAKSVAFGVPPPTPVDAPPSTNSRLLHPKVQTTQRQPQKKEVVDDQPRTHHTEIKAADDVVFSDKVLESSGTARSIPTISFDKSP